MIDWTTMYRVVVPGAAIAMLVQVVLFILLRPRSRMEWATTGFSVSILVFFATLSFWLLFPMSEIRPVIYPPLVIAAVITMLGTIAFTVASLHEWADRRR